MNLEIERKFLILSLPPEIATIPSVQIRQGFLNADKNRVTRIRVTSESEAFLTVKGKAKGASRVEIETSIDPAKAELMLAFVEGCVITKYRRKVDFHGKIWEVDVFLDDNAGLMVAEIELQTEDEAIDLPPWVGEEVTIDPRYSNSNLAMTPYTSWQSKPVKRSYWRD